MTPAEIKALGEAAYLRGESCLSQFTEPLQPVLAAAATAEEQRQIAADWCAGWDAAKHTIILQSRLRALITRTKKEGTRGDWRISSAIFGAVPLYAKGGGDQPLKIYRSDHLHPTFPPNGYIGEVDARSKQAIKQLITMLEDSGYTAISN